MLSDRKIGHKFLVRYTSSQEKWSKNTINLCFWSSIRSLVTIKKFTKDEICKLFWKQKNKNKLFEMILIIEPTIDLVTILVDKMQKFGMNFKISKHKLGPKDGTIPAIDIETVEEKIKEVEEKIENSPEFEMVQFLMSLYENVALCLI